MRESEIEPKPLTAADRAKIDEVGDAVETWFGDFEVGRAKVAELTLRNIFDEKPGAMARADRRANPKFAALLERIESDGRISADAFTLVVRVVAFDHLLGRPYRYWRRLKPPVKEKLLPLVDPASPTKRESLQALDDAARHAVDFDLDREGAAAFVRELQRKAGKSPRRNAGFKTYDRHVDKAIDAFATTDGVERLEKVCDDMPAEKVSALEEKLRKGGEALLAAAKRVKGRGKKRG